MLLSIVIPCLNEERTITRVVAQAATAAKRAKIGRVEVIVADNGSTDGTLKKLRIQKIARVVHVPVRGYGAALHWGILRAKSEFVLYADADLSYSFYELKKLVSFLKLPKKARPDLVLGSRFLGTIKKGAMPFLNRYLGTPVLTLLIRWVYGLPVSDCNSGMRLVRRKFYETLKMQNAGMEWASELLIRTALEKGKYAEVPITLYPDKRNKAPHLVPWADGWRHLKAIVLLKPNLLFMTTAIFFVASGFLFNVEKSLSIFAFLIGMTFFFCTLAAKLIKYALDGKPSFICSVLLRLPLVSLIGVLMGVGLVQFLLFPGRFQVIKILVLHSIMMYCIWVFFIETIKTHLLHKLPSDIDRQPN